MIRYYINKLISRVKLFIPQFLAINGTLILTTHLILYVVFWFWLIMLCKLVLYDFDRIYIQYKTIVLHSAVYFLLIC